MLSTRLQDIASAFLISISALPALLLAFGSSPYLPPIMQIAALPHAVLAIPVYILLRRKNAVSFMTCLLTGFLVASIPYLALPLVVSESNPGGMAVISVSFGFFGLISGFLFWLTLKIAGKVSGSSAGIAQINETGHRPGNNRSKSHLFSNGLLIGAIATSLLVYNATELTKDRTCHNLYGDSEYRPKSRVYIDTDIPQTDRDRLATSFIRFAQQHRLDYRLMNAGESVHDQWRSSLCSEEGLNIVIVQIPEYSYVSRNLPHHDRFRVAVYDQTGAENWENRSAQVFELLEENWAGKSFFSDGQGNQVTLPDEVAPFFIDTWKN